MAATYTPISSTTASGSVSSITLSSIPSTYTDLVLVINAGQATADNYYGIRFNGDTATNYSNTQIYGTGTSVISNRNTSSNVGYIHSTNENFIGDTVIVNINNYANATTYKTVLSRGNTTGYRVVASVVLWRSTSAINSLTVTGGANFTANSTFTLYGITAA